MFFKNYYTKNSPLSSKKQTIWKYLVTKNFKCNKKNKTLSQFIGLQYAK